MLRQTKGLQGPRARWRVYADRALHAYCGATLAVWGVRAAQHGLALYSRGLVMSAWLWASGGASIIVLSTLHGFILVQQGRHLRQLVWPAYSRWLQSASLVHSLGEGPHTLYIAASLWRAGDGPAGAALAIIGGSSLLLALSRAAGFLGAPALDIAARGVSGLAYALAVITRT
jgi:hypothetical protein